ncbi:hypothetical protein [Enterovibrio baiacu]|uniref:hypothetical protein n=1 Tax=Enterovibrio baiacu TaxID=2491023 RepID=UPI001011939D|nr:hypothetical protein [Enterovibrio baiacu]MBE1277688.1 hypothetical protein [Enterovibrio baiacu]
MVDIPEEWELIDFFGSSKYKSKPEDGFHCYELNTEAGLAFEFSLNIFQSSVLMRLEFNQEEIVNIYQEAVLNLCIENSPKGKTLIISFDEDALSRSLIVRMDPTIHVSLEEMVD